jgi:hypothetical protein
MKAQDFAVYGSETRVLQVAKKDFVETSIMIAVAILRRTTKVQKRS